MSTSTSPAAPPFSYAQAARGRPAPQATPKSPEPTAIPVEQQTGGLKSGTIEPGKLDITSSTTSPNAEKSRKSSAGSEIAVDQHQTVSDNNSTKKENIPPHNDAKSLTEDAKSVYHTSSSLAQQGTETSTQPPKSESPSSQQNESSESWDKQSEVSTYVEKSTQTSEKTKGKESEDDWEKISASAFSTEAQLRPAPVPIVNIWMQRKAEQAAKVKESSTLPRPAATTSPVATTKSKTQGTGAPDEGKRKTGDKTPSSNDKDGNGRRRQDASRPVEGGRREQAQANAPRPGSQHKDNQEPSLPPPVGDAESWPTPDTVPAEERRKSATIERSDSKSNGSKTHTNKWTPVPYVPSVVFETQLPPAAARRGGRPGNRGREGNGRGALNANNIHSDKVDATNMPPPPLPRQHNEQERGRRTDAGRGGRAASVPTQGKRSASVNGVNSESRKVSENAGRDRGPTPQSKPQAGDPQTGTPSREVSNGPTPEESRSASRPGNNVHPTKFGTMTNDSHAHPTPENDARQTADWPRGSSNQGQRNVTDSGKDRQSKGSLKDSRAKVESWRDQTDQPERREGRPERGRGGTYRGNRGQHSTYSQTAVPPYTAPLPQQSFPQPNKPPFHENRHRQSTPNYGLTSTSTGGRNNLRSQSIATATVYQPYPNGMPGMQPLSPVQTDLSFYPGTYNPMHPGIMNAMPYSTPLETLALMSMVSQQVEYYFSIDNLCKDMFLRRHMDSQGWVPISVIATFKRIRSLTEDINLLRMVCSRLTGVEFLPGENGEQDRLRSREKWSEFVLDAKDRLPEARNDGPPQQAPMPPPPSSSAYPQFHDPYYAAASHVRSPSWNQASFHGGPGPMMSPSPQQNMPQLDGTMMETPISATAPDFSATDGSLPPNGFSLSPSHENATSPKLESLNGFGLTGLTNGYHTQNTAVHDETEDVFPNESIAALRVVSRKFDPISALSQPPFVSNSTRTFSNGSIDGATDIRNSEMSTSTNLSGLRGGAGSPEQLERMQIPQSSFVNRSSQVDAPPILWSKQGPLPVGLHQEGMTHELYLSVRERALQQHMPGQASDDMDLLYQFWSHFLVRNFNVAMYQEFRNLAIDDLQNGQDSGVKNLVRYYEAMLTGQATLSDRLVQDIAAMAGSEPGDNRLAFQKLRSAWRNGAFSMKSRAKFTKILPSALREELEK